MKMQHHFDVFADGSCVLNGQPGAEGGWAFVVTLPKSVEIVPGSERSGKIRDGIQNSNRAELEAVLQAVLWIQKHGRADSIYTLWIDSEKVVGGITGTISRTSNRDIWAPIERIIRSHRHQIRVKDVDAHVKESMDPRQIMNNHVDVLARKAANSLLVDRVPAVV